MSCIPLPSLRFPRKRKSPNRIESAVSATSKPSSIPPERSTPSEAPEMPDPHENATIQVIRIENSQNARFKFPESEPEANSLAKPQPSSFASPNSEPSPSTLSANSASLYPQNHHNSNTVISEFQYNISGDDNTIVAQDLVIQDATDIDSFEYSAASKESQNLASMQTFTLKEIAEHDSQADCFVIIHGRVYDITTYLSAHPGGANLILKNAGRDCTSDFEGMFHSQKARVILERYCIGVVEGASTNDNLSVSAAGKLMAWRNISGVQQGRYKTSNGNGAVSSLGSGNVSSFGKPPMGRGSRGSASGTSLIHQQIYTKFQLISREACKEARDCFVLRFKLQRPTARLMCPLGQHLQLRVPILPLDDMEQDSDVEQQIGAISLETTENTSSPNPLLGQITSSEVITLQATQQPPRPRHMERKYTPTNISQNGSFELLVKCYPNTTPQTSVSHYLCHTLQYHDHIEMRGPFGTYQYTPNKTRYLGMMVCGSGITPVYRIIESIVQNRKVDQTKIILLYANRSEKDIILRNELEQWAEKDSLEGGFQLHHILSNPEEGDNSESTAAVHYHRNTRMNLAFARQHFMPQEMLQEGYIPNRRDFAALICGTEGFTKAAMDICNALGLNLQSQVHVF